MKKSKLIDWQYVLGLLIFPFFLLALVLLAGWVMGKIRNHPTYFTNEYVERYSIPSQLLTDLETAIRNGDSLLMAKIQGSRPSSEEIEPLPKVRFLIFWDEEGKYSDYLFMDTSNYHRYMQHIKVVNNRYVRVPEDLYYFVDSGKWVYTFGPIYAMWWLVVILFTIGVWIYRYTDSIRNEMYGPRPRLTK